MEGVEDAEKLTRIFGRWPSFHDSEVLRIELDRTGELGPTLKAEIHVFEMTGAVDATGHYVLKNHTRVTFLFFDVCVEDLGGFNEQNVLFDLRIERINPEVNDDRCFQVEFIQTYGVRAAFKCTRAVVLEARPLS